MDEFVFLSKLNVVWMCKGMNVFCPYLRLFSWYSWVEGRLLIRFHFFIFFKYGRVDFIKKYCLRIYIMEFNIYYEKVSNVYSCDIFSKVLLNSVILGTYSCFLVQPYGIGFAIACPYWLFRSIFNILLEILFFVFYRLCANQIEPCFFFIIVK